eukprot:1856220-Pyramimonas_sp.AAC.1
MARDRCTGQAASSVPVCPRAPRAPAVHEGARGRGGRGLRRAQGGRLRFGAPLSGLSQGQRAPRPEGPRPDGRAPRPRAAC